MKAINMEGIRCSVNSCVYCIYFWWAEVQFLIVMINFPIYRLCLTILTNLVHPYSFIFIKLSELRLKIRYESKATVYKSQIQINITLSIVVLMQWFNDMWGMRLNEITFGKEIMKMDYKLKCVSLRFKENVTVPVTGLWWF